jgi:hypothetical protein
MLVRPSLEDVKIANKVNQLVFRDAEGHDHQFELYPNMSAASLKRKIDSAIVPPPQRVWMHVDEQFRHHAYALMKEMYPKSECHDLPPSPGGLQQADAFIGFRRNAHYYRAVAKIAFHYYLTRNRRGLKGHEPCFAAIRKYILEGGDRSQFFRSPQRKFAVPWGTLEDGKANVSPDRQWGHILAADETAKEVFVYVQLFVGPGCIPDAYYVMLGTIDSDIIAPGYIFGHAYVYYEVQPEVGKAGKVSPMSVTPIPEQHVRAAGYFLASGT